jgi:hypothetical protein
MGHEVAEKSKLRRIACDGGIATFIIFFAKAKPWRLYPAFFER